MDWIKGELLEDHGHERHYIATCGNFTGVWVEIDGEFDDIIEIENE